jgi:cytochrome o ubiquinol oxidase subunit 2
MLQRNPSHATSLKAAALAALLGLLAGCERAVLNPAGDIARQQRDIIYISTGLMLLIIVPVMILIVVFAWRYRQGKGGTYDPDFDHSTGLELVIWSAPLLIIIILGALTWSSTHLLDPFRPIDGIATDQEAKAPIEQPLRIQVVSLDWKWLFIYPEQRVATVNQLVLPVNRQVRFDLTSTNMMNTFYAPTLAGMIYVMPGMQSTLHAVLNRPGNYEGLSGNYSGHGFADMRFKLHGVDQAGFDNWVRQTKGGGRALDLPTYMRLVKPSEKVPPIGFATVDGDLYRRILERCVEPGTPCMSELMKHDQMRGGGDPDDVRPGSGMPQRGNSMPMHGQKPEGALLKDADEKGRGQNVTDPAQPEGAGGAAQPTDLKNRDLSALDPRAAPFARAVAQA